MKTFRQRLKQSRASLETSQALKLEREAVHDVSALLKSANEDLRGRMKLVSDDLLREMVSWSTIESPSENAQIEYESLTTEINGYLEVNAMVREYGLEEMRDVALAIAATRKTDVQELLSLTSQMRKILAGKLENDIPRRQEIISSREQAVQRLSVLIASESHNGTS